MGDDEREGDRRKSSDLPLCCDRLAGLNEACVDKLKTERQLASLGLGLGGTGRQGCGLSAAWWLLQMLQARFDLAGGNRQVPHHRKRRGAVYTSEWHLLLLCLQREGAVGRASSASLSSSALTHPCSHLPSSTPTPGTLWPGSSNNSG